MMLWAALAGGFVGSLVVVLGLDAGRALGLTRLEIPVLLGSALFGSRNVALAAGYGLHLSLGLGFAAIYAAAGVSGWGPGALAGLLHGAVAVPLLFPVVLPLVHPRMALWDGDERALLEAPGPLTLAYGRWTPALVLALHVAYGTIVGGFAGWQS